MGKIRCGNYVIIDWIGDHGHHIHIYREGKQILKWDIEKNKAIKGKAAKRILKIIDDLKKEGLI